MSSYIVIAADGTIGERAGHPAMDPTLACHGGRVIRLHDTAQNCPNGTLLVLVTCAHAEDPRGKHPDNATATGVAQSLGYEPLHGLHGDVAVARFAVDQAQHVPLLPGDPRFIKDISGIPDSALRRAVITAVIHDSIACTAPRGTSGDNCALAELICSYPSAPE